MKQQSTICHVVAVPYPGRGHINPMMNLCKQLSARNPQIIISFVVTEEWLGFIGVDPKPDNIRFATLPNVIPSELGRAKDFPGFIEAVRTKLVDPFEQLLDRLDKPSAPSAIIADTYLVWATGVGNRRNIPVVSLWTMSATVLCMSLHLDLLKENHHFPVNVSEKGHEVVDYLPGVPPTKVADIHFSFISSIQVVERALQCIELISNAQYLLFTSTYELEPSVIDVLKSKYTFPVYSIGPSIPYSKTIDHSKANYIEWLDSKPENSVLYVSLGSFLSVSDTQMDEIVAGIRDSGVFYLWVARGDVSKLKNGLRNANDNDINNNNSGLVVHWCDQLRVLSHPSIGGFWSHCGFNSTLEAVYTGTPVLTFPIMWDQIPNGKAIVEDWNIGWRVKRETKSNDLVRRDEIKEIVIKFMDLNDSEGIQMRQRAKELSKICHGAVMKGGSSDANLDSFIQDISGNAI